MPDWRGLGAERRTGDFQFAQNQIVPIDVFNNVKCPVPDGPDCIARVNNPPPGLWHLSVMENAIARFPPHARVEGASSWKGAVSSKGHPLDQRIEDHAKRLRADRQGRFPLRP
jgi:hypothetical protein